MLAGRSGAALVDGAMCVGHCATFCACKQAKMKRRASPGAHQHQQQRRCATAAPSSWPVYALLGTVSVGCYLNGLAGDFVHDDIPAITNNKDVLALNPLIDVFTNDFWGTPMADVNSHKSYRPLTILTFRANYLLFGLNPVWFHATNILLHMLATLLFTRVCMNIASLKLPFATLAGLIFAVHPIHTEAVTGIVGRADVLACVFFLISLLAYHGSEGQYHLWTSILTGGISMLAKETGITVFLLNLAYDIYRTWPHIRKTIVEVRYTKEAHQLAQRAAKILICLGVFLTIRIALLQGSLPRFSQQDNPTAFHPSLLVRILTFSYLAAFNWWLMLCPATLAHDWQMGSVPLVTSLSDTRNLVTCLFLGFAFALTFKSFNEIQKQQDVPVVVGLLLLVLPFLPATNLVVTVGFVIAERVLYMPSMGSILLTVHGAQILWQVHTKHRQTICWFLLLILTTQGLRCFARNKDWHSRETLLKSGLLTLPHNAKMHYNFGNFLRDSSHEELAKMHYRTALRLWPTYASAHNNLGTLIEDQEEAERHFLSAIRISKDHVNAHYNLGQLYRKWNRKDESKRMLRRCLRIDPKFTPAYLELARLQGPHDRNVGVLLKRVVHLKPNESRYLTIYAHWLYLKGNPSLALKYYWRSLLHSPMYLKAIMGAARTLRRFGAHARLLQLIIRYQSMLRLHRGEITTNTFIYLQDWHLKKQLNSRTREYDKDPQLAAPKSLDQCIQLDNGRCISAKGAPSAARRIVICDARRIESIWTNRSNETNDKTQDKQHPHANDTLQEQATATEVRVPHILGSV